MHAADFSVHHLESHRNFHKITKILSQQSLDTILAHKKMIHKKAV